MEKFIAFYFKIMIYKSNLFIPNFFTFISLIKPEKQTLCNLLLLCIKIIKNVLVDLKQKLYRLTNNI